VTAHYSQDLPEGEYAIKQPAAGGLIAAAVLAMVTPGHCLASGTTVAAAVCC